MKNLPHTSGTYWAKANDIRWWNATVKVYGDFPFFKVNGFDFCNDKRITDISEVAFFGGKIEEMP